MMKIYMVNGITRQYEEGTQPDGAVEVMKADAPKVEEKKAEPSDKAVKPKNKSRKAAKK